MARIKSKWWKPSSLGYASPIKQVRRQEQEYREWLAAERGWSEETVIAYLKTCEPKKSDG
jgi:hypothetical protein